MPDIVTMAKGIGNGLPLAAVVTTPEIAQARAFCACHVRQRMLLLLWRCCHAVLASCGRQWPSNLRARRHTPPKSLPKEAPGANAQVLAQWLKPHFNTLGSSQRQLGHTLFFTKPCHPQGPRLQLTLAPPPGNPAQVLAQRLHFNTFGGNPVCSAGGRAVLRAVDEDGVQAN